MSGTYMIPNAAAFSEIGAVLGTVPYRNYKRDQKKDNDPKKKKKTPFKEFFEKEAEKEPGQMGCFFEAKA